MDDEWHEVSRNADGVLTVRRVPSLHDQVRAAFIAGYDAGLAAIEHWDGDAQQAYERWREGM